jgi:hypothetical protein
MPDFARKVFSQEVVSYPTNMRSSPAAVTSFPNAGTLLSRFPPFPILFGSNGTPERGPEPLRQLDGLGQARSIQEAAYERNDEEA